jgi:hypothetical protein
MAHTESDMLPSDVSSDSYSAINYSPCDMLADPSTIVMSASDILSPTSLAFRPDSPESMSSPEERSPSQVRRESTSSRSVSIVNANSPSSSRPCLASQPTAMTKRQYALHELLSSERAYASDLALIRDIHLPLALGESSVKPFRSPGVVLLGSISFRLVGWSAANYSELVFFSQQRCGACYHCHRS